LKEARYHQEHAGGWVVRLGDGTAESAARMKAALDTLWPYVAEIFESDAIDEQAAASGLGPRWAELAADWREEFAAVLDAAGLGPVRVEMRRAPAWTTDWMSEKGRRRLREYGIAPPGPVAAAATAPLRFVPRPPRPLACPRCESRDTERISAFGATACNALWRCRPCRQPFEHFKPILP